MREYLDMTRKPLVYLVFTSIAASCFAQQPEDDAMQGIRPEAIEAHMRFLADDLLEGRGTGTRGYEIAAKYLVDQFEAMGLEPGAPGGSYFQPVALRRLRLIPEESSVTLTSDGHQQSLTFGKEFLMLPPKGRTETSVSAPVVFVGYGVVAPELGYDDYAGLDVRGKIVAVLADAPSRFPSAERAHFSSGFVKQQQAAARGAIGLISFWVGEMAQRTSFERMAGFYREPRFCWLSPDGTPSDYVPEMLGSALLSKDVSKKLFEKSSKTLEQVIAEAALGKLKGFPLGVTVSIHGVARHTPAQSPNVVAVLPGSDPRLRNEYVVYTAHLDHLGIGTPVDGDSIYNGAEDNASGVAALIEVARAFTRLPQPPRRSILFVAVTGEEAGLLGSDYFARYPTVPKTAMAANVNIDGITLNYDFRDVVAYGEDHSSLGKFVHQAAQHMDLEVSPDPMPEEAFFIRSDQYSLVRQGVPAVMLSEGFKTVDPALDGRKISLDWEAKIYHTPKDDMNQPLNFKAAARSTRLNFLVGYLTAQADERPEWNPGDFFGKTFGGRN